MLLLESYARNYWKMQSKYLIDKPATRKLVELLVQRNDKFSRRLLVEMMQFREEETKTQIDVKKLIEEHKKIGEEVSKLVQRLMDKGEKFRWDKLDKRDEDMVYFFVGDVESAKIIKKLRQDSEEMVNLQLQIEHEGSKPDAKELAVKDPKTGKIIHDVAVTLQEYRDDKNAKSILSRILIFFGANFKLLWEKLTTKYKLPFWGSIILGLLIVAIVTIVKYGKQNVIAKVIKNVLIASITGFALYNLIVLIMSLKDQFSKEEPAAFTGTVVASPEIMKKMKDMNDMKRKLAGMFL
jgi:hypothetical protein